MTHSCDRHSCKISLQTFILVKSQLYIHARSVFPFMLRIIAALGYKYKQDINYTISPKTVTGKVEAIVAPLTISMSKKLYLGEKNYIWEERTILWGKKLYLGGKWPVESIHGQVRKTLLIQSKTSPEAQQTHAVRSDKSNCM